MPGYIHKPEKDLPETWNFLLGLPERALDGKRRKRALFGETDKDSCVRSRGMK